MALPSMGSRTIAALRPQSDVPGAAAAFLLQLTSNPSSLAFKESASFAGQLSTWDFVPMAFFGLLVFLTAAFERTAVYSKLRPQLLGSIYFVWAIWNALLISKYPHETWRNAFLRCVLPGLTNALAHKTSNRSLLVRLAGYTLLFSAVLLYKAGLAVVLLTLPTLIGTIVSAGLLALNWNGVQGAKPEKNAGSAGKTGGEETQEKALKKEAESQSESIPFLVKPLDTFQDKDPDSKDLEEEGAPESLEKSQDQVRDTWNHLAKAASAPLMTDAETSREQFLNPIASGDKWELLQSRLQTADPFGSESKLHRRRGKKPVEEKKARKRAPSEVAIVMGAEVSRLVSVSKVMEIDDAQEFLLRAQMIMNDGAVRAAQEVAQYDPRIAKPVKYPEEMNLMFPAPTSEDVSLQGSSGKDTPFLGKHEAMQVAAQAVQLENLQASSSISLEEAETAEVVSLSEMMYERAQRCVDRLGYEWAALKWEESQVEVRALGALKTAVLDGKGEEEVLKTINLVRDARRGLAMLATASCHVEPWHALERRGCRAGLLFGPLWVTPLLAKDAGRAAWVAQACRTEGLVGESVLRVYPQLGMGQARALAATCRDMERIETQLEAELTKLRTATRPWLRGGSVDPHTLTGMVLGNLGDEVEQLSLQADELQLQLFEHCKEILTPLQMGTLLLALMDQRMRLQRLGSFWESVAAGQDVMTGVRKLTGRLANFNA